MSPEEAELVRSTWRQVEPNAEQLAVLFHDRLFEIAPDIRPLFRGDVLRYGDALMRLLSRVVQQVEQDVPTAEGRHVLGLQDSRYSVYSGRHESVRRALLWTLEQGLADDYTPEVAGVWRTTSARLVAALKDAVSTTQREGSFTA